MTDHAQTRLPPSSVALGSRFVLTHNDDRASTRHPPQSPFAPDSRSLDEMIEVLAGPSATYACAWYLRRLHVCEERTYTEQDVADGLWKTYRLINGDSAR